MYSEIAGKAPSGFGLGVQVETLTSAEMDNIHGTGWFYSVPIVDGFTLGLSVIQHMENSHYSVQEAYLLGSTSSSCSNVTLRREQMNDVWQPWEWVNPPMQISREYRTTEKYKGKPVYIKLIDGGYLPNTGMKSYKVAENAEVFSFDCRDIPSVSFGGSIAPTLQDDRVLSCYIGGDTVYISCGGDRSNIPFEFTAKYTKTTDHVEGV